MLCWREKKRGVAAKGNSRAPLTRLSAAIPTTQVAPAATKLAEAEKHVAFAYVLDSRGSSGAGFACPDGYKTPDTSETARLRDRAVRHFFNRKARPR
jgi:hypothetical protein